MTAIRYQGRLVAIVDRGAVRFAPAIGVLERDHPRRRFVGLLALYADQVDQGAFPAPYCDRRAEAWARAVVMPADEFDPVEELPDHEVAEYFAAPLDQVVRRRAELAPVEC